MSRVFSFGVIASLVLAAASPSEGRAQAYYATGYSPYAGPGYDGYYGGYHSATAAEGILRGRAELVQAYGLASIYYTQALKQREEARSLYIDNQLAVRAYYAEQRKLRNERRRADRLRRLQMAQQLPRQQNADRTAAIEWPPELRVERYAPARAEIEALAQLYRSLGDSAGEATDLAIRQAIRNLAKQVMKDEESSRFNSEQSQNVRQFVRTLSGTILQKSPSRPGAESLAMNPSRQR